MKKLGIFIGTLFLILIGLILVVPLFVDVDKYRPQIVEAVNQQINGKLELGKLSLSLWGQVKIEVGGLKLKDSKGSEIVAVKDAYFHLPFFSIFTGAPVLNFKMSHPVVTLVKNRSGQINAMTLIKKPNLETPQTPSTPPAVKSQQGTGTSETPNTPVVLPGIVTKARLGIELSSALINYKDESTGLSSEIKDLNFIMKDISLNHPTELEMWADLDTKLGRTFLLRGPAKMTGKAQPDLKNGKFDHITLSASLDMDGVEMQAPGVFEKKKGMSTRVDLSMFASEQELKIEKFQAKFFNAEVNAHGTVTNLASTSPTGAAAPVVNVSVKSNEIQFKPWVELVPLLKEFDLGGVASLEANVQGPSQKLNYRAKFAVKDLTAKAPNLKAQPKIDAVVNIATDQIESLLLTLKAPANDLKVHGKVVSFSQPKMNFEVTSSGMDLDQLIVFPPPAQKGKQAAPSAPAPGSEGSPKTAKTAASEDYDAMLAPLRENKMLVETSANVNINMAMIKAYGVKISDIACKFAMKDLAMGLEKCGMKVFSGAIHSDALFQLKPKTPIYRFNAKVDGLDIGQAVESQFALFKNTVTGKAHFLINGQGVSFNPDAALSNLKANGNLKVDHAVFATVDIGKMVSEALNKALGQIGEKIPGVKGKSIGNLPGGGSKYEFISSDFTIVEGKFSAPNFYAKAVPNQGVDLRGSTTVGLKDHSLDTRWDVIDTYNLTHARDLSIEQNGIKVEHLLAEGNSPVHFPVRAGCTLTAPCYSYTDVASSLGAIALKNVSSAAGNRAKEEVKKKAESLIKQAPPALQDKLKGLFR